MAPLSAPKGENSAGAFTVIFSPCFVLTSLQEKPFSLATLVHAQS